MGLMFRNGIFYGNSGVGLADSNSDGTGEIFNDYGSNVASGQYSHAEGSGTEAGGVASHAEGNDTTASGQYSHTEGSGTTASGTSSHAEGSGTKASSVNQHVQGKYNVEDTAGTYAMIIGNGTGSSPSNALTVDWSGNIECGTVNGVDVTQLSSGSSGVGQIDATSGAYYHGEIFNDYTNNKATGQNSHAEGQETTASNTAAHAEGYQTTASKYYTHSEGYYTTASGMSSHAEGDNTTASGDKSHAEGANTTASGSYSHAEGYSTTASGSFSHAEGSNTTASGIGTHAEGIGTKVSSSGQHVQGKFNIEDTNGTYAMIIGNGSSDTARSNCFTVDWDGKINGIDIVALAARVAALEGGTS